MYSDMLLMFFARLISVRWLYKEFNERVCDRVW